MEAHDGPDSTCGQLSACFDACLDTDEACLDQCYSRGSYTAQESFSAVHACIREHNCQGMACVHARCRDELTLCEGIFVFSGPDEPEAGALSCLGILHCADACPAHDAQCHHHCMNQGSAEGRAALDALTACAEENRCDSAECLTRHCSDEGQRCEAHAVDAAPEPPPALDCVGIYQCANACDIGDHLCQEVCHGRGTPRARSEAEDVAQCVADHRCVDEACVHEHCHAGAQRAKPRRALTVRCLLLRHLIGVELGLAQNEGRTEPITGHQRRWIPTKVSTLQILTIGVYPNAMVGGVIITTHFVENGFQFLADHEDHFVGLETCIDITPSL